MQSSQAGLGSVHMQGSQSVMDSQRSNSLSRQESGASVQSPFPLSKGTAAGELSYDSTSCTDCTLRDCYVCWRQLLCASVLCREQFGFPARQGGTIAA